MIGKFDVVFVLELRDFMGFLSLGPYFQSSVTVMFIFFPQGTVYDSPFNGENTRVKW